MRTASALMAALCVHGCAVAVASGASLDRDMHWIRAFSRSRYFHHHIA